jgi:putative SOS response-associated peptidase YedK
VCGRYTLTSNGEELARHFEAQPALALHPRYNVAPTQEVPVVRRADAGDRGDRDAAGAEPAGRLLAVHRWGLIPSWAKDPSIGSRLINARSETAASKPAFRDAMRRRRCIVPMTGFYEWRGRGRHREPSWFHPAEGEGALWAAAGLWERWWDERGALVFSCTILTTDANAVVGAVHDRMPVLLSEEGVGRWLDPRTDDPDRLRDLLAPWPDARTAMRAVSTRVNDARAEGPELLAPREGPAQGDLFG